MIVSSRKREDCQKVVDAIIADGGKAEALACHIGEMAQIEALFAELESTHGWLDVLVNNAATNPYFGPITETDPAVFQKTVDVNIRGYFYMSSHGAKLMAARPHRHQVRIRAWSIRRRSSDGRWRMCRWVAWPSRRKWPAPRSIWPVPRPPTPPAPC